jgi:3',5'-cyclic AMP phosphodiesterase CpdA
MNRSPTLWTRREFGATALAAAACAGVGWPWRACWAAETGLSRPLRFVFYTDIHARVEWGTPEAMALAAAKINEQGAELILCGGDLVTDGFESDGSDMDPRWAAYMEMHGALRGEVHAAIGNHDLVAARPKNGAQPSADPRAPFRERMGLSRTYYSFHHSGVHFVVLDPLKITDDDLKYHGWMTDDQLAWLAGDLAAVDPATPIVLMLHMPLLTSFYQATEGGGVAGPPNRVVQNNREVLAAFAGRRLLLVLQGHLHVNEMLRWQDTTFITGGAVAGKWWRGNWHGTEEGFGVVTLHPDRVDWQYIDYGWTARRPPNA